jgi:presenilin-like A22 family membrane protease
MKHTWQISALIVILFFLSQVVGLLIVYQYVSGFNSETNQFDFKPLPFGQERPDVDPSSSFLPIAIAILIGTVIALALIRFEWFMVWRIWFFIAVWMTVTISLSALMPSNIALVVALILAILKVVRRSIVFHNITEVFVYSGIAAIIVPVMNLTSVVVLLVIISIYDFWAVFKSKHMIKLAKAQSKLKVFAGLMIPYKVQEPASHEKHKVLPKLPKHIGKAKIPVHYQIKSAILGGGDMAFALLFAGVAMKYLGGANILLGFEKALIIPIFTTAAIAYLLYFGKKDKFYPAMPFVTIGSLVGFGIASLI